MVACVKDGKALQLKVYIKEYLGNPLVIKINIFLSILEPKLLRYASAIVELLNYY